ncbi:glycosyltransferase family 2 protein [Microbacterium sp. 18062]|uniref:glycosyltransferase n=1 Tax=Microbacterium sp. 18062 TaxID=2681410 RepID=UPI001F303FAD|nr:glycosyltransferase [Microbacterium sp. 18062]
MIRAVAVVVPAHDEEELLEACLASLGAATSQLAASHPDVACAVWVVLDACRDGSERVAETAGVGIVRIDARNVGAARAAGLAVARRWFPDVDAATLWTAHTDADSVVPAHWLTHQVESADAGADVVVGTVRPDFRDLDAIRTAAWWARYSPEAALGAVHGANLGVRASTLDAVGGFPPLPEHEDVRLVEAARTAGARIVATDGAWVRTSGRQQGRTPGGYARYLREDLVPGFG